MLELPTADRWFVRQRFDDGIILVTEPHVHPMLRCNVWLVEGRDVDLLVDTGLGLAPLKPEVERDRSTGMLAVATHAHADHVGGLHEFAQRAIHPAEAPMVAEGSLMSIQTAHFPPSVVDPYDRSGYELPELLIDAVPSPDHVATVWEIAAAPATRHVVDGDVIDLGNRAFEVLHLPGHSPGSIGLWEESTGTLFSGDAIYDGPLLDELETSDIDDYIRTIERLRRLPVRVVHGGHEPSFGPERLIEICDAYLEERSGLSA